MQKLFTVVGLALAMCAAGASAQSNIEMLIEVMARHGIDVPNRDFERGFDQGMAPSVPVTAGSFATPLAVMTSGSGQDRTAAAFAFAMLAGRSGRAAGPQELAAAGQMLVLMMSADDRRTRVAGARASGRLYAAPLDGTSIAAPPAGMVEAVFALLNRSSEIEQLAAMDAIGLMRVQSAVTSVTERYHFYRDGGQRALAGGALEALARIGDPSSVELARSLGADRWCEGRDATALACAFARERLLKDGSLAMIRAAAEDRSRRWQARSYLTELGVPVP